MPANSDTVIETSPIYKTTNYDQFHRIKGNRDPDEGHVKALMESMVENGNLTHKDPIVITKDKGVFDGQTRLEACKRLGYPVCYKYRDGVTVKEMRIVNTFRKNWNWFDFATSYKNEQNNPHYADLLRLYEEYKQPFTILMTYSCGRLKSSSKWLREVFFKGDFKIPDINKTRELLDMYEDYIDAARIKNHNFAKAVYRFIKDRESGVYNHQHMLVKLKTHRKSLLTCYFEQDYLATLQDIWRA